MVIVQQGASTDFVQVYAVPFAEPGPEVARVEPPGAVGFPPGEPALFPVGGSVGHRAFVNCGQTDAGTPTIWASIADLSNDLTEYLVYETALTILSDATRYGYPGVTGFAVAGTRDYTVPFDPDHEPDFQVPGEPCW